MYESRFSRDFRKNIKIEQFDRQNSSVFANANPSLAMSNK